MREQPRKYDPELRHKMHYYRRLLQERGFLTDVENVNIEKRIEKWVIRRNWRKI